MPDAIIKADVGGYEITIGTPTFEERADLDTFLDMAWSAIARQTAKIELAKFLNELATNKALVETWDERKSGHAVLRAEARTKLLADWQAEHDIRQSGGRRPSSFRLSTSQRAALDKHDQDTKDEQRKFDLERASNERNRISLRAKISRQRAVIAGRDADELLLEVVADVMGEAADAA